MQSIASCGVDGNDPVDESSIDLDAASHETHASAKIARRKVNPNLNPYDFN
jgi:hypothetical protein